MKYYDKDINKKSEEIRSAFLIILLFVFGFSIGTVSAGIENQKKVEELQEVIKVQNEKIGNQEIELESLKEIIYMYNMYE